METTQKYNYAPKDKGTWTIGPTPYTWSPDTNSHYWLCVKMQTICFGKYL